LEDADVHAWEALYSDSAVLRTVIGFVHIAGLVIGGGCAIAADRATLIAYRRRAGSRGVELSTIRAAHRVVIAGLVAVSLSGALLLAADTGTYLYSRVFWLKMGLVAMLLANGAALRIFASRADEHGAGWRPLAYTSGLSLALWLLTTLAGAALPNVG
jgi:hypothetical protein